MTSQGTAEREGGLSQVTEVKAIQLASDIAEQEKEPILYADSWIVANTWGLVATKEEE